MARDTFVDPLGAVYLAGYFVGTVDLDPTDGVAEFTADGMGKLRLPVLDEKKTRIHGKHGGDA